MLADPRGDTPSDTSRRLAICAAIIDAFDECFSAWAAGHLVAASASPTEATHGAALASATVPQVTSPDVSPAPCRTMRNVDG